MDFSNCIHTYKDKREGGRWRRVRRGFLHLGGVGIIDFSYIFMEGFGKGWKGG
jgi:hypothetical protein